MVTLAANILWGRIFNRPAPRGPLFVTWQLTYDCNAYCTFCSTHKLHKAHPDDLPLDRALEIADEIAAAGTWVVGFTGGEVLLHPHLFPLVRRLKQHGLVVYFVTNGALLEDCAEEAVASGVDYLVVSIDSDSAAEHDGNRKVDGLFDAALRGIARVKALRRAGRPLIKTTTVISAKNIDRLGDVLGFLEGKADVVSAQPVVWGYKDHPHGKTREQMHAFIPGEGRRAEIEAHLAQAAQRHPLLRSSYFRRIPQFWYDPASLLATTPCWSPFLRLTINPAGKVLHCGTRFGMVGDLRRQRVIEAWNSPAMLRQREVVRTRRNRCICWSQDAAFNDLLSRVPLANALPVLAKRPPEDDDGGDAIV